ncbi:MAG: cytochrome c oxidase subunit II [Gemmatimonadota bacterium]
MTWFLPPNFSTQGEVIDLLFWIIMVLTGTAFVLVEAGIVWFMIKYRTRDGRKAHYTHGSKKAEIIWITIPALIIGALGIYSGSVWASIRGSGTFPDGALTFSVVAKQFEWNITYPGPDGQIDTADDFTVRNQLHFPAYEPVIVRLRSEDVIHSFFVPELRVKQDAVPGMTIPIWFEATGTGEFQIACAELCGLGHYRMAAQVVIHERADFDAWSAAQAAGN